MTVTATLGRAVAGSMAYAAWAGPVTACVRVAAPGATSGSAAAATVTVRASDQFVLVKIRACWLPAAGFTSTVTVSVVPPTVTVTARPGLVCSRTVYVPIPVSGTVRVVGVTSRPSVSSSVTVTVRSGAVTAA